MKYNVIRRIAKGHIEESHITFQFCVSNRPICLMGMFPGPDTGTVRTLCQCSVRGPFCIDQCDVTVVGFRFFINHVENTFRSGKSHDDGVKLLRNLQKRLCEASGKLQIRRHDTKSDAADSCDRKDPAEDCGEHELQISHVADDGSHHGGKGMGCGCALVEFFI